ncbi:MAG: hypothetical protein HFE83_07595 [Lachnospiraceae bacterium]|nr:hypothetical protein [Lachnospiraceae bacterium]
MLYGVASYVDLYTAEINLASKAPIFYNGKVVGSDGTIENLRSFQDYDMIVNMYLLDDTGIETITLPAVYPFEKPICF